MLPLTIRGLLQTGRTRIFVLAVAVALALATLPGCDMFKQGSKNSDSSSGEGVSSAAATNGTAPASIAPPPGPAAQLGSGTWQSQGTGSTWFLRGGKIYYQQIDESGMAAGAYEVADSNHIRLVIFQDFGPDEDNWDPDNPATYPWQSSEVVSVGTDRVRLVNPSLMSGSPMDFEKV